MKHHEHAVSLVPFAPESDAPRDDVLRYAGHLAKLLNDDGPLLDALGLSDDKVATPESVLEFTAKWCRRERAQSHAIVLDGERAIGLISLSHMDEDVHFAYAGFWIGSAHWNRGYATQAFDRLLDVARAKGFKKIFGLVDQDNAASQKIWENREAKVTRVNRNEIALT